MSPTSERITLERVKLVVDDILGELSEFCFLLGSAATPRFRQDSDIDIAVF